MRRRNKVNLLMNPTKKYSKNSSLWYAIKVITKFTWFSGKFIVKNTPTAIGVAWEVKKEITNEIVKVIDEVQKEQKQIAFDKKMLEISAPKFKREEENESKKQTR